MIQKLTDEKAKLKISSAPLVAKLEEYGTLSETFLILQETLMPALE
jgi:hypothetical protein